MLIDYIEKLHEKHMTSCYLTYPLFKRPTEVVSSGKIYESNLSELDLLVDSQIYQHLQPTGFVFLSHIYGYNLTYLFRIGAIIAPPQLVTKQFQVSRWYKWNVFTLYCCS